ncbi:type IV pilus biogenesis protein PilM [Pseudomonas chlororaphis]|uniref:PilM protein n=1 Tax=Pseudomonas chlororaphis TaxID=587753 RepID=A0AAX3FT51_9PSED|nr:PilM protein [Pseudomonas chlororaphis]
MALYWLVLVLVGIAVGTLSELAHDEETTSRAADLSAIASNLMVYRNALSEYAQTHSSITGPVPDSALSLPNWYVRMQGVSGYVRAGISYTYYPSPTAGLVNELSVLSGASVAVGFAKNGRLVTPNQGVTNISIPLLCRKARPSLTANPSGPQDAV